MGEVYRPGFTKGSKERIEKKLKAVGGQKQQAMLPPNLESGIAAMLSLGLNMGQITQMELTLKEKKVRLICVPAEYGEVMDDKRVIVVPNDMRPVLPAPQPSFRPSGIILPPGVQKEIDKEKGELDATT